MGLILGFDFGGTKLAVGLYDREGRGLCGHRQCPTPTHGAEASLAAMVAMARGLLESHPVPLDGIGVSFGGPVAPDGRVVRLSMHVPGWEQMPLADRLEREFEVGVRVANDGDAAALAEHRLGAGQGVKHMLYVTVSTGIGGGVIIDGDLHRGERGWAGEVGHIVLDPNGPDCPCGRNGCLESLASGLSVAREMRQVLAETDEPSGLRSLSPEQVTAQRVALAACDGDPAAWRVWMRAMEWLGIGLGSAANLLNPGRIVVGGGLTRSGDLLFEPVRAAARRRAMDPELAIVQAQLGDDVGILAGVSLWV